MVKFVPGFCFSSVTLDGVARVVVNVCGHESVGVALAKNMSPVDSEYLDVRGIDNLIIPISVSTTRELPKTAEYTYCIDVVVHPGLLRRCNPTHRLSSHYVEKLTELALQWIKQENGLVLLARACTFLGLEYYNSKSAKSAEDMTADVMEAVDKMLENLQTSKEANGTANSETEKPEFLANLCLGQEASAEPKKPTGALVQEVNPNPGIKKGFLLSGKARLYDERGSHEGGGRAPDPLAHIPASLRDKCKIVDTRGKDLASLRDEVLRAEKPSQAVVPPGNCTTAPPMGSGDVNQNLTGRRWQLESVSTAPTATVIRVVSNEALRSVADIELCVSETYVMIDDFRYTLSHETAEELVKAKYVKSSQTLVLTCPVV